MSQTVSLIQFQIYFIKWLHGLKYLKLNTENEVSVYNTFDLTFIFLICCHIVAHTLADSRSKKRHLFTGRVMKRVERCEPLSAESLWKGCAWDGEAQSHFSLLGPLLTLKKSP